MREFVERPVAVVTGGAAGIGEAICHRLAQDGMAVVVADIDERGASEVARDIECSGGVAKPVYVDVASSASVDRMLDGTMQMFGHLNYLAANAGIFVYGSYPGFPMESFDRIWSVNVTGTINCCQAALARMRAQESGCGRCSIAITTSEGSFSQDPPSTAYIASKWAVRGFMRSLALAARSDGVTVNAVGPGSVYTDLHRYVNERFAEMNDMPLEKATELFAKVRPIKGYQTAEEIAALFSFLFSDNAAAMTGVTLLDNGGHVMA